jgi:hypothetical protein
MFDPERVLRMLVNAEVEFVVIGGIAQNLHGYDRYTGDIDFCYRRTRDNVDRLVGVLRALEAQPRNWPPDAPPFAVDRRALLNGDSFTFDTVAGDVDILGTPSGTQGFDDLAARAERMPFDGDVVVPVVSLADLIAMKRAAGRPKDIGDLSELERLQELKVALDSGAEPPPPAVA